jgi:sugar phosphate isomerase/epimerase
MENYMHNTGIFHWYGFVQPFEERIKLIKESGYNNIMLWWEDEVYPRFIDKKDFIKIIKSYDLNLDNVHFPFDNINSLWLEGNDRHTKVDEIKRWMNECRECGAETVVLHSTNGDNIALSNSIGYRSFEEISKEAENIKLRVALENTQMMHYLDFILHEIKSDFVGLCYDSSHDFINGQSCGDILDKWKDILFCVHLSDCDGINDKHWIPGKGIVDWGKIINIIKTTNCNSFSMETYPSDLEKELKPDEFLIKARNSLLKVLGS